MVSSSHFVSAAPSSSQGRLLTLFCSSVRSLSWKTVLHKLLQPEPFSRAAALRELTQRGSFPQATVLQEHAAPVWVPHSVTNPASKSAPLWGPLSPWVCRSLQEPAPAQAPHGVIASFRHPPALAWNPFHGL